MATTKNDRVYVRVNDEIKDDFEIVAEYRGLKTSALLHSLIVKTIHEQRELTPQIFTNNKVPVPLSPTAAEQNQSEKISVSARPKNKTKKSKETLSTGGGEMPLVDEASSAADDEDQ